MAKGGRSSAAAAAVPAIALPAAPASPKGRGEGGGDDALVEGEEGAAAGGGSASPVAGARLHPVAAKQLVERTYDAVTQLSDKLENAASRVADFNAREAVLGLPESTYEALTTVVADFEPFRELWSIVNDFEVGVQAVGRLRGDATSTLLAPYPLHSLGASGGYPAR